MQVKQCMKCSEPTVTQVCMLNNHHRLICLQSNTIIHNGLEICSNAIWIASHVCSYLLAASFSQFIFCGIYAGSEEALFIWFTRYFSFRTL